MTTGLPHNDLEAFYVFLGKTLESSPKVLSPEDSVREFRTYQEEVRRLRSKLAASHQEFLAGQAKELDTDAIMGRVRSRIAHEKGISD